MKKSRFTLRALSAVALGAVLVPLAAGAEIRSWSKVDLGEMTGTIMSISGDSLDNLYLATGNQIWQRSATEEKWTRRADFDAFLEDAEASPHMSEIAAVSMSAAGGFIMVGGAGWDTEQSARFACFNGTRWSEVNTAQGVPSGESVSYVATKPGGDALLGDIVTVVARGAGRLNRFVNGVGAHLPVYDAKTPDHNAESWSGIDASPAQDLLVVSGNSAEGSLVATSLLNNGASWAYTATFPETPRIPRAIRIIDENTFVVGFLSYGGDFGEVQLTSDGGETWTKLTPAASPWNEWVLDVWADSPDNIYAAIRGKGVWHYVGVGAGGGDPWIPVGEIGEKDSIYTIHRLDGRLWFGGSDSDGKPVLYTAEL